MGDKPRETWPSIDEVATVEFVFMRIYIGPTFSPDFLTLRLCTALSVPIKVVGQSGARTDASLD